MKKALFISLDGMTDPLGQSQVLPYLEGLSKAGFQISILSFEKSERYEKEKDTIERICSVSQIVWIPIKYFTSPQIISKAYNRYKMFRTAQKLQIENNYDLIHCRSYQAAEVGMFLKKKIGVKFLFDMRGFWADEKKEGGLWNQDKWVFRKIYQHYKKKEQQLVQQADHIVSLTFAGKKEIESWDFYSANVPITVIPCCADMSHFTISTDSEKKLYREQLNIPNDAFVLAYLGSIGSWYMLDEMLILFKSILNKYPNALFLFITHSNPNFILNKIEAVGIPEKHILIKPAKRIEVPKFVKTADIAVSFIQPVYSKLSSSPTKLGEIMAMGIPVITNSGVGDVAEIVNGRGIVLDKLDALSLSRTVELIPALFQTPSEDIRSRAKEWFDLNAGIEKYTGIYKELTGD